MAARIIDMFTRKPWPAEGDNPDPEVVDAIKEQLTEFKAMAAKDPNEVSAEDQEWFCAMFRDMYLGDLIEAMRGIEEADLIPNLEHFMAEAMRVVGLWPKVRRA